MRTTRSIVLLTLVVVSILGLTGCAFTIKNTDGLAEAYKDIDQASSYASELKSIASYTAKDYICSCYENRRENSKGGCKAIGGGVSSSAYNAFGSYARGTADAHSDIDLLVIGPYKKERKKLMVEMDRVLWGLGMARDIVVMTPKEFDVEKEIPGTVARYAWKEGKSLYEQKQ